MKKILITVCLLMLTLSAAWAVKARPGIKTVKQPDGSVIQIKIVGDENCHYTTDIYGNMLVKNDNGFYRLATADEVNQKMEEAKIAQRHKSYNGETGLSRALLTPCMGSPKLVVLLVQFPDRTSKITDPEILDKYMNSSELSTESRTNYRSVRRVYEESSFGKFSPVFEYHGPFTMPEPETYYAGTNGRQRFPQLVKDAVAAADSEVDFSKYDSDNDGYVDGVILMCAGTGQNETDNKNDIWPVSGSALCETNDGVYVYRACQTAELMQITDDKGNVTEERLDGNGTFCHEFGHMLGLPDLYTTNSAYQGEGSCRDNFGMEYWSMMDAGCYIGSSCRTMNLTAWEREILGWYDIKTLDQVPQDVTLKPLSQGGDAYRIINPENPSEYWILENRQRIPGTGDRYIYGHGMLITHVDYDESAFGNNDVNYDPNHPRMYIVAADGCLTSTYRPNLTLDEFYSDPFPGTAYSDAKKETFVPRTEFNDYNAYNGLVNLPITEITEDTQNHTVSFKFMGGGTSGITEKSVSYQTSPIYTLDGVRVGSHRSSLPHGIYIQNGKKFVK